ncbi:MAG: CYTH domain-containing protein [Gammaproteobacteria bacterium]|nr:CYTH domain-containing protein [Gammaproteobacteria bacterium]
MPTEIERKFFVINKDWENQASRSDRLTQGYLTQGGERSVRVRTKAGGKAFLNIKSSVNGISRLEYEYEIPHDEALEILENIALKPMVDKVRHIVKIGEHTWEIDVFSGENQGLIIAEVELGSEDEEFVKPDWLGAEVSGDPGFYNMNIPNQEWRKSYPEELLLKYGGTVHETIKYELEDCIDGC